MAEITRRKADLIRDAEFPDRLKWLEERLRLKPSELALRVGVRSTGTWARWYRQDSPGFPRFLPLYQFGSVLRVNLNWLILGDHSEPKMRDEAMPVRKAAEMLRSALLNSIQRRRSVTAAEEMAIPHGESLIEYVARLIDDDLKR